MCTTRTGTRIVTTNLTCALGLQKQVKVKAKYCVHWLLTQFASLTNFEKFLLSDATLPGFGTQELSILLYGIPFWCPVLVKTVQLCRCAAYCSQSRQQNLLTTLHGSGLAVGHLEEEEYLGMG